MFHMLFFLFKIGEPLTATEYAQDLIRGELTQRLFGVTQKIHKKLPPETGLEEGEESVFPRFVFSLFLKKTLIIFWLQIHVFFYRDL